MAITLTSDREAHAQSASIKALPPAAVPPSASRPNVPRNTNAATGKASENTLSVYNSGDPTPEEQYLLELINRARANPGAEGMRIDTTTDADVSSEFTYWAGKDAYEPTRTTIKNTFATYPSRPPLAFNSSLLQAATNHSNDMLAKNYQAHQESDGSLPWDRAKTAGYGSMYVGENIYAYGKSMWETDVNFMCDFGFPNDTVFGHRENMLNFKPDGTNGAVQYTEVGLGVVHGGTGLPNVGPIITTEDFGDNGKTFILGVVYTDANKNNFYDVGEGASGVTITVSSGAFSAVTSTSGGYAIPFTSTGNVTVTAKGGAVGSTPITKTVNLNGENVKVDFILGGAPAGPNLITPQGDTVVNSSSVKLVWNKIAGATNYHVQLATDAAMTKFVVNDSTTITDSSKLVSGLKDGSSYYWRVAAKTSKGWGTYSAVAAFSAVLPPGAVTLLSPANAVVLTGGGVAFSWNPATPRVSQYWLQVAANQTFSNPIINDSTVAGTSFSVDQSSFIIGGPQFFWRVRAENDGGWSAASPVWSFTISSAGVATENGNVRNSSYAVPSPTTGLTSIHCSIAKPNDVTLKIFNSIGDELETIRLGTLAPDEYDIPWNGSGRAAGVYFYQLRIGEHLQAGRIVLQQ